MGLYHILCMHVCKLLHIRFLVVTRRVAIAKCCRCQTQFLRTRTPTCQPETRATFFLCTLNFVCPLANNYIILPFALVDKLQHHTRVLNFLHFDKFNNVFLICFTIQIMNNFTFFLDNLNT